MTTPLPSPDSTRLIVCEKSGVWAKLLRRSLPDRGRWIVETRSLSQMLETFQEFPNSFALAEVTVDNCHRAPERIEELRQRFPNCQVSVAMRADSQHSLDRGTSWLLRELGATVVVGSSRDLHSVRQLWEAHSQIHPPKQQTLRQRVFEHLPWSDA